MADDKNPDDDLATLNEWIDGAPPIEPPVPARRRGDEDAYQAVPQTPATLHNDPDYRPGAVISLRHEDGSLLVNRVVDSVYSILVGKRREYVNSLLETGWRLVPGVEERPRGEADLYRQLNEKRKAARKPFEFTQRNGEELTLHTAVFEALGAASTSWTPDTGNAVFDSANATDIGNKLIDFIQQNVNAHPPLLVTEGVGNMRHATDEEKESN